MFKKIVSVLLLLCLVSTASAGTGNDKVKAIIVFKDKPTTDDISYLEKQGGAVKYNYNIIPGIALEMPAQAYDRISGMCAAIKSGASPAICDKIASLEPDSLVHIIGKSNTNGKGGGKSIPQPAQVLPWGIDMVDAELSRGISTGSGVKVAVVDTGIDTKHPDLHVAGGVSYVTGSRGYNDDNGHGTHVAGTIAALDNSIGVVGVAPEAALYSVKVLDRHGSGWMSDVIAGIDWSANNGMQVISMSLGGPGSPSLQAAVDNANGLGSVVVAAAGNDYGGAVSYPAKYDSVIAVTATDSGNNIAYFSSIGHEVEMAAPGVEILSTYKGGSYATLSGTSMATPHVTGTVALILETPIGVYDTNGNNEWDPIEVRNRLHNSAIDLGTPGPDNYYGYGLVNAFRALS